MANEDPAAVIGADEHGTVPALTGEYADLSAHEAVAMQAAAWTRANNIHNNQMNVDNPPADDVKMIILDGVVMAPMVNNINYLDLKSILTCTCKHCAFQKFTKVKKIARGGAFCDEHEIFYGNKCCIIECAQLRVQDFLACLLEDA